MRYLKRICDEELAFRLESKGAVLIEGPKWCGKTTTAEQQTKSALYLQDPSKKGQYLRLAQIAPSQLLGGKTPRLLDEWQLAPELWDAVRFEVDQRSSFGQFVLTGSTTPMKDDNRSHSGTGRIARMRMRTMSLAESGDSSGEVSLSRLFEGGDAVISRSDVDLERLAFLVCRGGWPQALIGSERVMLQQARDYLDSVAEVDMSELDGTRRDSLLVRALLRSYARMSASQASLPQITADVIEGLGRGSASTVERYVAALQALFVIEDLKSWNPNLRSKTAIRTSDTRHLVDPAIAAAALGAGPKDLINDLSTFGLLFESLCVRDLRVYAQALGGDVFHYRDKRGLECDAVIHLRDGRYGLIEVKLGGDKLIEEGASSLRKLRDEIDVEKMPAPSFLMVLTGVGDFSYPREDDVFVVPIATLGV